MKMAPSFLDDIDQIQRWTDADPYHNGQHSPEWWLTGGGVLAFRLDDNLGAVFYAKIVQEGNQFRMHCQFAPSEEVSKRRVVCGILWALPRLIGHFMDEGEALVFNSISPSLVNFFLSQGFTPGDGGDYVYSFKETSCLDADLRPMKNS